MNRSRPIWMDALLGLGVGIAAFACSMCVLLAALFAVPGLPRLVTDKSRPESLAPAAVGAAKKVPAATAQPTPRSFPHRTVQVPGGSVTVVEHLILEHPVSADAKGNVPDWFYLYGNTQRGKLAVHHGVEFVNPTGTPLLSAANGEVVVAGTDMEPQCGESGKELCGVQPDYYGKLVVIQLDEPVDGQPLYILYGHMDSVEVKVGQHVKTGERLGTIGSTGVALGPHVHFEVRYGENSFGATRNPILWLKPWPGNGSLVGRVVDAQGKPIRGAVVYVSAEESPPTFTETYGADEFPAINGDDTMSENFAMGDLPAGEYQLRVVVNRKEFKQTVTIEEGKLTYAVLGGEQ